MKFRLATVAAAFLSIVLSSPAGGQSSAQGQKRSPTDDARFKQSVAAQKTINRYFHEVVVPKLNPCWGRVQGKGTIAMKYLFADDRKGGWSLKSVESGPSSLPRGQDKVALNCMQRALSGTSFPREKGDQGASYLILWDWPVPFPPDAAQQVARMWDSGGGQGGGCDGRGAQARCLDCSGSPLTCVYVCVGYDTCEVQATKPGGFNSICTKGGKCASGGPFGLAGVVMY